MRRLVALLPVPSARIAPAGAALIAAVLGISAVLVAPALPADEAAPGATVAKRIPLGSHGAVVFKVPAGWKVAAKRSSESAPPTLSFDPPEGEGWNVQITLIWRPDDGSVGPFSLPNVRKAVEKTRDTALQDSTSKDLAIDELPQGAVQGYSFSAIDRNSKGGPGDWKYMTQGSGILDDLLVTFTILGNDPKEPEAAMTLAMLAGAVREPPAPGAATSGSAAGAAAPGATGAAAKPADPGGFDVRLQDKPWALRIGLPGFHLDQKNERPDGSGAMMQATNDETKVIVSAFIEREKKRKTLDECKRYYWGLSSGSPFRKNDVHEEARPAQGMIAVHYVIPELQGIRINQKNVNAYLYKDGTCIDVHLSKVSYDVHTDEPLFKAILDTVEFVERK